MYSTCLFCHRDLGRNEFVEHFQVGRRLAFDSAKGPLWVVCRGCERWNIAPLEERWEAIEDRPTYAARSEMAAHEEIERQAMEGELARLEDEWRDAEEIAAIADNMFVPNEIQMWIEKRRGTVDLPESQTLVDNKE